ncbi:DUF1257 domain-containing protein [Anabaena catenula]|uniref:DUF1257 domain-containing protein n=1 Tax=Anabaena catenula TaxID=1296320 RepID=UPI0030D95A1D
MRHQVLQELGYQVEQNTNFRGYRDSTTNAEYVIRKANSYDLGFRKNGESYELMADFGGAKNQQEFINNISQKYAYKTFKIWSSMDILGDCLHHY